MLLSLDKLVSTVASFQVEQRSAAQRKTLEAEVLELQMAQEGLMAANRELVQLTEVSTPTLAYLPICEQTQSADESCSGRLHEAHACLRTLTWEQARHLHLQCTERRFLARVWHPTAQLRNNLEEERRANRELQQKLVIYGVQDAPDDAIEGDLLVPLPPSPTLSPVLISSRAAAISSLLPESVPNAAS
jgi:hypothetical protein